MAPIPRRRGSTKKRNRGGKKTGNKKKQGSESKRNRSLTDLPSKVLVEILTRLPLRTLLVARSVCKTFLFLSTPNPHFINLHSSNAPQILIFQFGVFQRPSPLLHMADQAPDYENSRLKPLFRLPKMDSNHTWDSIIYSLENSCNGLLFFRPNRDEVDSLVCNPVTREYTRIPDVDFEARLHSETLCLRLGFSPGSDQYKVVRICRMMNAAGPDDVAAQVFVIGSDSWRDIDAYWREIDWPFWRFCQTQHVNGIMYLHHAESWLGEIITFDFEREKFGEVALPPKVHLEGFKKKRNTSIGVLGGCLCLTCNSYYAHRVDLWVMRKCGNRDSWTKEFVVDTLNLGPRGEPVFGQFKPLQFLRNGKILMLWMRNALVFFDPRTKTIRCLRLRRDDLDYNVVALTPSFVPLKDALKVEMVLTRSRPRGDDDELMAMIRRAENTS